MTILKVTFLQLASLGLWLHSQHGCPQDFYRKWAMRGGRKPPQRGPGAESRLESRGEFPKSWLHFLKIMRKYFVYWDFRQHLQHKKHLQHFQGRGSSSPLPISAPCPCLRAPMIHSRKAPAPFGQYQIILLCSRDMCVRTICLSGTASVKPLYDATHSKISSNRSFR